MAEMEAQLQAGEDMWMLGFEYELEGFKKAGTKAFNVYCPLEIRFDKFKYSIGPGQGKIWEERLYHKLHNSEELEQIADRFVEMVVEDISQRIETLLP